MKIFNLNIYNLTKIEFNENNHTSNLSSVLSFYVYTIIALDYYSYSVDGGSYYMQKAQNIVNNAQGAQERGWKAYESNKNRYWIITFFIAKSWLFYKLYIIF